MKARVKRFYYEEIEEILEEIKYRISDIEDCENETEYYIDRKHALEYLYKRIDELEVN